MTPLLAWAAVLAASLSILAIVTAAHWLIGRMVDAYRWRKLRREIEAYNAPYKFGRID